MAELEPLKPARAKEMYLTQRRDDLAEETLQSHNYRLKPFVSWCDEEGITNLNDLTARSIHEYHLSRKEEGLNTVSLRTQLSTIRVFIQFCESIDAVEEGVSEKMMIPTVDDEEAARDRMIEAETAETLLEYQRKFDYASRAHALFSVLWHTGCRMGAAHSLDVNDFDFEEQSLAFRHRPDQGTRLKNGTRGERICALSEEVSEVLNDYIEVTRHDATDEFGREPLFSTRGGNRLHKSNIRELVYSMTRPCSYGQDCPHDRDPDSCEAANVRHASKCPSSVSPHEIRRGSLTHFLRNEVPKQVVSDRANVSPDVLDKHYNEMSQTEQMEQRRDYLDNV